MKDAYFRLAKRFHPDVHHGASLGDLRDKLEAVFIRLGEAYDVLRDPGSRGDYEERLGRCEADAAAQLPRARRSGTPRGAGAAPQPPPDPEEAARLAEEAVRRAAKLVEQEKYWDAIQLLEPAVEAVQGKPRLRAPRAARARATSKNPKWAKQRRGDCCSPRPARSPQAVGAVGAPRGHLRGEGPAHARHPMYRKALELKPDHEEAAQLPRRRTPRPTPSRRRTRAAARGRRAPRPPVRKG